MRNCSDAHLGNVIERWPVPCNRIVSQMNSEKKYSLVFTQGKMWALELCLRCRHLN